ncbi:hypothetical protein LY78DRAFT_40002 [Colletotrichum sublineola]|nr:hypothetical protein LY78DRAFT_40002 [Colletotrichum sublineola]
MPRWFLSVLSRPSLPAIPLPLPPSLTIKFYRCRCRCPESYLDKPRLDSLCPPGWVRILDNYLPRLPRSPLSYPIFFFLFRNAPRFSPISSVLIPHFPSRFPFGSSSPAYRSLLSTHPEPNPLTDSTTPYTYTEQRPDPGLDTDRRTLTNQTKTGRRLVYPESWRPPPCFTSRLTPRVQGLLESQPERKVIALRIFSKPRFSARSLFLKSR